MVAAVALRDHNVPESRPAPLGRAEVLARYRRLREISKQHNSKVQKLISSDAMLQNARRLGLAHGKTFVLDDLDELTYALDLAIHTAPADRSRAIDRYARSVQFAPGSDEMVMLDAMQAARFSILCIERRHEVAGLIVTDLFRRTEHWLVDIGLESSMPDGSLLATRLYTPDTPERFSMTAGVNVPFEPEFIEDLAAELPARLREMPPAAIVDDRRFAETIYRVALAGGVMKRVKYQDPPGEIG